MGFLNQKEKRLEEIFKTQKTRKIFLNQKQNRLKKISLN